MKRIEGRQGRMKNNITETNNRRTIGARILRWILRILAVCGIAIGGVIVVGSLFLVLNPVFGGRASKEERAAYGKRAENYVEGKFIYPEEYIEEGMSQDIRVSTKERKPAGELPIAELSIPEKPEVDRIYLTWFGHSTILLQMHGLNILFDPLFSKTASPVSFAGPERYSKAPITIEEMPALDMILLTHDHYDHLDMKTLQQLDAKTELFVVPLGVEQHLKRWGIAEDKIRTMAWWEEIDIKGLTIACTPARHYSSRMVIDGGKTLFASWVLKDEYHQVFESGDSGYGGHFKAIHEKYGDFDLVLTDCAQYNMQWHTIHMLPEEAAEACQALGAKLSVPIHWGAYSLSDHAWDDPAERFVRAAEEKNLAVCTPLLGETVALDSVSGTSNYWWRECP